MPKVSIIMNCYNSEAFLKEAIDSIYAQTFGDWEIIFWDDQSTDSSAAIAKSYDERLKYFYADERMPLGAARNKAMEKAQGEYITFLDSDDKWLPGLLERQIRIFEEHPKAGFVYGNYYIENMRHKTLRPATNKPQPGGAIFKYQIKIEDYSITMITTMFKSKLLTEVSEWFDTELTIPEDYDFFLRLLRITDAYYIEEPLAVYRVHGNNTSITKYSTYFGEMRHVANKLFVICNEDSDEVKNALHGLMKDIDILEARHCLTYGDSKKAAELFGKHNDLTKKEKVFYMLSKLPGKAAMILYNCYMSIRLGMKNKQMM